MKAVIAIDSFKGSLTSVEAGDAIKCGIHRVFPDAEVLVRPLADGGEGTVEALVEGLGGSLRDVEVTGPAGKKVTATYGIVKDERLAVMEMSQAAGITLVSGDERNPLHTTTYGVGEMIVDAIKNGCLNFIIGIGGSATNDGGIGMLQALGFGMLDEYGKNVPYGAKGAELLARISDENVIPELSECTFNIACDVTNPLCGTLGCSAVYGPQKGATAEMVEVMDGWLENYAKITEGKFSHADQNAAGAGAAGGLGFAFPAYLNGKLRPGIELILEKTGLEEYIKDADIVITGEGRLDFQTAMGKAPIGVAKLAKKYQKPVLAFAGSVTKDADECNKQGIDAFFPILRRICTLDEAMDKESAKQNMSDAAEQAFRMLKIKI
ncbi:MAG: glycerate kinase [Ruminococcaceae bacterium]|nr:glycerate kinase [Oscillospiraceae bacterium]